MIRNVDRALAGQRQYVLRIDALLNHARGARDPKAWDEAVSAGLLTRAQARDMRAQGSGYLGWRVLIDADGGWGAFIGGD